jgi:hypothetical protein
VRDHRYLAGIIGLRSGRFGRVKENQGYFVNEQANGVALPFPSFGG